MVYDLGIVIPVYRSRDSVKALLEEIKQTFSPGIRFRICLVDDSGDGGRTAAWLREACRRPEVTLVVQKTNGGQQKALLRGLKTLKMKTPCRYYATIDDDMQQSAADLLRLYEKIREGYDVVYGIPEHGIRGETLVRRWGSRLRDLTFSLLLGVPKGMRVSSLRVMTADLVSRVLRQAEGPFFYLSAEIFAGGRGQVRTANLSYVPRKRMEGRSGYNVKKLICLYGNIFRYYVLKTGRRGRPL